MLGRLTSRLSGDRGWAPRLANGSVFGRWAELVGEEVAEHARPVSLRDGVLTVAADSTAWATQLRLLQRQLIGKLAAGLGDGVVKTMRIHGPTAPSWRRGPRHVSGPRTARHVRLTVRTAVRQRPTTGRQRRAGRLAAGRTLPMSIRAPCDALSRVPGPFWDG